MTMNNNTKCPTPGNRTTRKKSTAPPLPQEALFMKTLKKSAARQKTFPTKSDKRLSYALLKNRFDYEEHMFRLTEALQKASASWQEMGSIYALLENRQRRHGTEDSAPWFTAEEKADLLEVAAKLPSAVMLGDLSLAGLCDVAGIVPDNPSIGSGNSPLTRSMENANTTTTA